MDADTRRFKRRTESYYLRLSASICGKKDPIRHERKPSTIRQAHDLQPVGSLRPDSGLYPVGVDNPFNALDFRQPSLILNPQAGRLASTFAEKMKLPAINGIIRRRILLNYRIAPEVVRAILPSNFQPKLVDGYSIAGICLIRLDQIRPKGLPKFIGISSGNSAHRIAVEWEDDGGDACEGVFVPRRDTDSRLNSIAGGRIFPGVHHLSNFLVNDHDGVISLQVTTDDDNEPLEF